MAKTNIEWTDRSWNPIVGCSRVSAGCEHCYAERMAGTRLKHTERYKGLTRPGSSGPLWTGETRLIESELNAPLRWRNPQRIFVCDMGDLFHESVPAWWIDRVFSVMRDAPHHTYQILTKRPIRLADFGLSEPHIWLGTSVEDQATADKRIPILLETPAAVRFVSAEPLLGPIQFGTISGANHLSQIIVGGESGPKRRPVDLQWMRDIRDQCKAADIAFFCKQIDKKIPIPDDLMIREFPQSAEIRREKEEDA